MGIEVRTAMKGLVERLLSDGATGDILLLSRTAKAWTESARVEHLDVAWLGCPEGAWQKTLAASGIAIIPQLWQAMGRPDLAGVASRSGIAWSGGEIRVLLPDWRDHLACLVLGRREADATLVSELAASHGLVTPWDILGEIRGLVPAPYGRAGAQDAFLKRHVFSLADGTIRWRKGRAATPSHVEHAVGILHARATELSLSADALELPELQEPIGDFAEALKAASYEERIRMLARRPDMESPAPEVDALVAGLVWEAARQGCLDAPAWVAEVPPLERPLVLLDGGDPNATLLSLNVVLDGDAGLNKE